MTTLKLIPLLILGSIVILFSSFTSMHYDESFYASAAKNFSNGKNFSTAFHDYLPHEPGITTGPVILIPNAVSIGIFGNTPESVRIARLIIILTLLALSAYLVRKNIDVGNLLFLLALFIFFFSTETSGTTEQSFIRLTYQNLGDLPAAAMIMLSAILMTNSQSRSAQLISGLSWGLTLTTKIITIIPFGAFLTTLLILEKFSIKNLLKKYFSFGLGFLPIPLYWFILGPIMANGINKGLYLIYKDLRIIGGAGSGAGEMIRATSFLDKIQTNFFSNIGKLAIYLEGYPFLILLFALIIYALIDLLILDAKKKIFPTALILGGFFTLLWWIFLPERGWIRHLYPGFMALLFGLCVYILEKKGLAKWILTACAVVILLPRYHYFLELKNIPLKDEPRKVAQLETVEFIKKMQATEPKPILVSCGDFSLPDLEYLLPTSLNFKNCFWLSSEEISRSPVYLVKTRYWFPQELTYLSEAEKLCPEQIYKKEDFEIWKCTEPEKFSTIAIPEGMKKKVF